MAEVRDDMEIAALDWVIRLRDPAFDGWEEFSAWLAADPAHATAYHRLAVADEEVAGLLGKATATPRPAVAAPTRRPISRHAWLGGALAASVAALIGLGMIDRSPSLYEVRTAPGERKTITLDDGSIIAINGGTTVTLDRNDPRHATLHRGEAMFNVVHDANAPFKLTVGDTMLLDRGTRFNVLRKDRTTAVQVAEGTVVYKPDSIALRLDAGRTLRAIDGDALLALGNVSTASIAGWKDGRLSYDGQTMDEVAADLTRWSGQQVLVDPRLADRRLRGVLSLRDGRDIVQLASLLDIDVRRRGREWVLLPKA